MEKKREAICCDPHWPEPESSVQHPSPHAEAAIQVVRSGQGHLSGSVPSGGLCTHLPQWIQAPAHLGSPCLQLPLSFYLPGGPEPWGHPTPLSTRQRDSLTNPRHLWVAGLVPPLEIPSLKPARICTSRSRGCRRSGLGSTSAARRTFCERFAGPSVGGGTRVAAGDPVPVACSDLFLSVSRPLQGCPLLPVPAPSLQREGPPARGLQVSLEQKSPSLQYSVASGCRIHRSLTSRTSSSCWCLSEVMMGTENLSCAEP
ncbi:uncharacterized protein [Notamacropus eugenii]|uniref:uncharacterized protein n=1 Tax=Notamacropus eugenii TaxID=9315 RepID=UPI003B675962